MRKRPRLLSPPVLLFGVSAAICVALALVLSMSGGALSFTIHDNYFVIPHAIALWILGIGSGAFAFGYLIYPILLGRNVDARLGTAHYVATVIGIIALVLYSMFSGPGAVFTSGAPRRYYANSGFKVEDNGGGAFGSGWLGLLGTGLLIMGQLIFLYNLIRSFFKPRMA